jgi:hypothetical protein
LGIFLGTVESTDELSRLTNRRKVAQIGYMLMLWGDRKFNRLCVFFISGASFHPNHYHS